MKTEPGGKARKYFQNTKDGKMILRKMMKKYVPEEITQAEKKGFSSPDASWFKGDSIEYVKKSILNQKSTIYDYLDFDGVGKLVSEHLQGKENRRLLIWSLLNLKEIL